MRLKGLLAVALCALLPVPGAVQARSALVLEFGTLVGVSGVFVGSGTPIRGVPGGGFPWVLDRGRGELRAAVKDGQLHGRLEIEVRGLIIPASQGPQFGLNPVPFFLAAVNCLTQSAPTLGETVFTAQADTKMLGDPRNGNANIDADIVLPSQCVAPVVFVTSPGGAWFAATGMEVALHELQD